MSSQRDHRAVADVHGEHVEFPSRRGGVLVGDLYRTQPHAPLLVLCHGMESSRGGTKQTAMIRRFVPLGYTVLCFDFSFVGESDGAFENLTVRGEVDDLHGALDFAAEFRAASCTLIGSSLGGMVALLAASQRPDLVAAVATIAAVADAGLFTRGLSHAALQSWRETGFRSWGEKRLKATFLEDVTTLDMGPALAGLTCPVLVSHGAADRVVPVSHARIIEQGVRGPVELRIFDGVDHRFEEPGALEALLDTLERWLGDVVRRPAA